MRKGFWLRLVSRSFGEPSFPHPLALFKEFQNGPQTGKTRYAQERSGEYVFYEEGTDYGADACKQENPPRAGAEVILRFDDYGVENTDDRKGGQTDKWPCEKHRRIMGKVSFRNPGFR